MPTHSLHDALVDQDIQQQPVQMLRRGTFFPKSHACIWTQGLYLTRPLFQLSYHASVNEENIAENVDVHIT